MTDTLTRGQSTRAGADETPAVRPGVESTETTSPSEAPSSTRRLGILKTYKLYIGGAFPRTESGRYDRLLDADGRNLANICRASRKDFRDAVVAARAAQAGWAARSAYNRSQILYRIGEMLEGRRAQMVEELQLQGTATAEAHAEVDRAVDAWVYFAGWADKLQQVFSSVNPVASSHFNFSLLEPTGVVGLLAPGGSGLHGLTLALAPIVLAGNTCVALASERFPLTAVTLAEALHSSDLPGGVVNLLTGHRDELLVQFGSHLDVNAVVHYGDASAERQRLEEESVHNLKRLALRTEDAWRGADALSPYPILDTVEVKTTWHPIGS